MIQEELELKKEYKRKEVKSKEETPQEEEKKEELHLDTPKVIGTLRQKIITIVSKINFYLWCLKKCFVASC